jgi:uncharacterized protein
MRALKHFSAIATCIVALCVADVAGAAGSYVDDSAQVFKPETIAAVNARDAQLYTRTGKAITVVTVRTTGGVDVQAAAIAEARKRELNGALIYIARDDKKLSIAYGANTAALFPPALQASIKQALRASFRQGDFDNGLITAVDAISGIMAGGASGGHGPSLPQPQGSPQPSGPLGIGWLWWVLIAIVAFFSIRAMLRRPAGPPATMPPGEGPPGSGPGYQSGGAGGFIPSLLGGAAGAYIGSELADRNRDRGDSGAASAGAIQPSSPESPAPDAGQGFSDSGGSGDFSGGGDSGGGGGDSGGGW